MTVQLATRPVLSQPVSGGWCRVGIFSASAQNVSPETQPVWVVAIATEMEGFEEKGIELLSSLEATYHSLELKSAEALFQALSHHQATIDAAVVAACITLTTITILTKNQARAEVIRAGINHTVISNQGGDWQAMEGNWQEEDVWWFEAGAGTKLGLRVEGEKPKISFVRLGEEKLREMNQETEAGAGVVAFFDQSVIPAEAKPVLSEKKRKQRRIFALGWIVLILLVVSVFIGSKQREKRILEDEYQQLFTQVEQSIAVVKALSQSDQVTARAQMRQTVQQVEAAKPRFEQKPEWLTKWQGLYDQANQTYQTISGETALTEVPVWYPLAEIRQGFTGTRMAGCGDRLVVWDQTIGSLVAIDIENKRNDIVAGGEELAGLKSVSCDNNRAVALANIGILDISLTRRSATVAVETDPEWLGAELVGTYNNNIYLVDQGARVIWRYPAVASGVGAKQNWFGAGVTLADSQYVRMAIDGQIWLLQAEGRVTRYTRGAPMSFNLSGLDQSLGSDTPSFAVDPDQDRLAILDRVNGRAVITNKDGTYTKQVVWEGMRAASDIAFSPNQDTLFVLSEGNIYAINF
jgi:hypothetical protein